MVRIIGYCRVSTEEQNLDTQEQAMKAAEKVDLFVLYKLNRLARSIKELYEQINLIPFKVEATTRDERSAILDFSKGNVYSIIDSIEKEKQDLLDRL